MENLSRITAKIDRYVYHNKDNSYSIVRVITNDNEAETIVGYIPILSEDIVYEFLGSWITHEKYGKQFQVQSYSKSETQSIDGLISYLSSSFFSGIGPVTAKKIVDKLGKNAIKLILEDKNVLKQFGFSKIRIEKFYQQLLENQTNEHILVALYGYNIAGKTAMKILNQYGILTLEKLEENPYQLITDIDGIGFIKADEIAKKLGISDTDPRRVKAAILFAMQNYSFQNGNIYLSKEELYKAVYSTLQYELDLSIYIDELINEQEIIYENNNFYLYYIYHAEVSLAEEFNRLTQKSSELTNVEYIESLLEMVQIQKNITYTPKQKSAIITSLTNKVSVITGGPGTGKTTIIDGIIQIYANYFNISLKDEFISEEIALMAPTGRAAKRMQEVLDLPAFTIHRQLGFGYDGLFTYDEKNKMPQKLIIIDESSMIDIFLANKLFQAISDEAQVIIVGDVDQLPSVGPGAILKDIIDSNTIPVVQLTEIHRQAKDSNIIKLAHLVNKQNLNMYSLESANDLFLKNIYPEQIKEIMINQIQGALNRGYDMINDIQVLIPTYKGDYGIDTINELLQKKFNDLSNPYLSYKDKKFYLNDKVIQLVNDPKNFVMNGDIGYVKRIGESNDNKKYLVVNFDGQEVLYEESDLDALSLAYAMSIHKSQGSEYKIVILPLVKQYMHMLKKELLYTAITRAKQYLLILGDMDLLVYAANHLAEQRKTTLKQRLINIKKIS